MLSFIVPAHNEEHELPATLRAIDTAAQAYGKPCEIIVVDDASDDATAEIAGNFGARVVPVHLRQIAAVRNAGAREAKGDILFFVDADTRIAPGQIPAAVRALEHGSSGGSARIALDAKVPLWARLFLGIFCALYFRANLGVGAFIFTRRTSFEAVGGFDEQYFAGEEVYLTLALKKLGPFVILREPIVTSARKVRMHGPKFVLSQSCFILFGGKRALRKRGKLDLWYDGKRESVQAQ
ncbi:MAG: glycosyltransferase [Verrucomicrobiota bacterium]|nr:glycosyltransferase [Verrucomicrobiota bacterium]